MNIKSTTILYTCHNPDRHGIDAGDLSYVMGLLQAQFPREKFFTGPMGGRPTIQVEGRPHQVMITKLSYFIVGAMSTRRMWER